VVRKREPRFRCGSPVGQDTGLVTPKTQAITATSCQPGHRPCTTRPYRRASGAPTVGLPQCPARLSTSRKPQLVSVYVTCPLHPELTSWPPPPTTQENLGHTSEKKPPRPPSGGEMVPWLPTRKAGRLSQRASEVRELLALFPQVAEGCDASKSLSGWVCQWLAVGPGGSLPRFKSDQIYLLLTSCVSRNIWHVTGVEIDLPRNHCSSYHQNILGTCLAHSRCPAKPCALISVLLFNQAPPPTPSAMHSNSSPAGWI
jgi:hypothetical protein